jgi:hypothetical protein
MYFLIPPSRFFILYLYPLYFCTCLLFSFICLYFLATTNLCPYDIRIISAKRDCLFMLFLMGYNILYISILQVTLYHHRHHRNHHYHVLESHRLGAFLSHNRHYYHRHHHHILLLCSFPTTFNLTAPNEV